MADLRCGVVGTKILYNETGTLKGFNGGWIRRSEQMQSEPYSGHELFGAMYTADNPFGGEIVTKPEAIKLIERDGNVLLTNTFINGENIDYIINRAINHRDRKTIDLERRSAISDMPKLKETLEQPEQQDIISIWNNLNFELVSLTEHGSDILRILYQEMQNRNVAISRDNSFLFDRCPGLSFVIVSELTVEDLAKKEQIEKDKIHRPCLNRETRGPYGGSLEYIEELPVNPIGKEKIGETDLLGNAVTQRKGRIASCLQQIRDAASGILKSILKDKTRE